MNRNLTCSECGGTMQEGYILDAAPGVALGGKKQTSWVEGKPERDLLGLKTVDHQILYITAYRCENCGFLKLYAEPTTKKK